MLKRSLLWLFLVGFAFLPAIGSASILTVDCDGGAEFSDIGPAVDAAQNGDVIVVRECSSMPFTYSAFIVSSKTDLHIVAGDRTVEGGVGSMPIGVGVSVASFQPLATITGGGDCVRVVASTRVVIKGFELESCGDDGVVLTGSTNVGIVGNKIVRAGGDGIRDEASNGSYINGNIIGLSDGDAVELLDSTNARVADNLIGFNGDGQVGLGVLVGTPSPLREVVGGALANTIINNTFIENTDGCILDAGGDTKIESNTCSGSTLPPRTIKVDVVASGGEITSNIGIIDDPFTNSDESDNCPLSAPC